MRSWAKCVGKWAERRKGLGRCRERERGEGAGPDWAAGKEMGRGEMMGWVVLGLVVGLGFLWVSSLSYFYFLVFFLLSNSNSNKAI